MLRAGLGESASRVVALRGALKGDVAAAMARTPELLAVPAEAIAGVAAQAGEAGAEGDDTWVVTEVLKHVCVAT